MSIQEYKKTLEDSINNFKNIEEIVLRIEPIVHQFNNKKLSRRMATTIEKATGLIVHWQSSNNYDGGKRYEMNIWGSIDGYTIEYKNRLHFYHFETVEDLQKNIDIYIENRNEVMRGVLNQKRYELENIKTIEKKVNNLENELKSLIDGLSDKNRDFGKISYALKDYIKSKLEV